LLKISISTGRYVLVRDDELAARSHF